MTSIPFESVAIKENNEPLVDLNKYPFILEPVYFKQGFADSDKMLLRLSVAEKLLTIQKKLKRYRFKIWDGYRPRRVQKNIYDKYVVELKDQTETFITSADNPARVPPHATGGAADLTLVDEVGAELNMGTKFDHFGPEAAAFYFDGKNDIVSENRKILREALIVEDFRYDADEWWHFDYGNQLWALELKKSYAIYGEINQ
ncbi:MAG: D-alanyl-D-alanine carboxypeptidase family protein [Candidatus Doudnabacteria bacterium]|nr:D-alanyl-D-alanine carboxypeptidase family protein [Candidatus Doudnabacteria bacterium]